MLDWDDELTMIQLKDKTFEMRFIGDRMTLFIQCETYEAAEIVRKRVKERGIKIHVTGSKSELDWQLPPSGLNWGGIIILPEKPEP